MSWERGSSGEEFYDDNSHLIDAGWIPDDQARGVCKAIDRVARIAAEIPDESLRMAVALLREAAGLDVEEGLADAAHDYFAERGEG